jgi:glycosyltransferase involved in cell wall biosynthesis
MTGFAGPDGATPATRDDPTAARRALAQRVRAVATALGAEIDEPDADPSRDAAGVLSALGTTLVADPSNERVWLAVAGIGAAFPTRDEVDRIRRLIELSDAERASIVLLEHAMAAVTTVGSPLAEVTVVTEGVLVDVDFTARHDLHTGIQRVVRQTVPLWDADHDIVPVAWTSTRGALRRLDPVERGRVHAWSADRRTDGGQDEPDRVTAVDDHVVLPWRSVIVLPEVPQVDVTPRIAGISACSNNAVVAIGHDAIPLLSADTLDLAEPGKFMTFLSALKFADRIAGVSHSSAAEFASFGSMLSSQGLPAPVTVAVPLPVEFAAPGGEAGADGSGTADNPDGSDDPTGPEVVVVGSHDPRKNHLAILQAAEILWQDGLRFRLSFIGSGGSNEQFLRRVRLLQHRGRDVRLRVGLSDTQLRDAVAQARFTVFPSLHEGYGLPVAESLALGTPVITTFYGSTAEIAADGGAVTVDPRDDASLTGAMRQLLTTDDEIDRLRAEIGRRPKRSWQDYADELWDALVRPILRDPPGPGRAAGDPPAR